MRSVTIASLLVVAILVGAGVGYLLGSVNERTVTSVSTFVSKSTSVITFVSTEVQTTTTTIGGTPIPIQSVETGNITIGGIEELAVNPNDSRIYVAGESYVLSVVDAVSHAVVTRVTLPSASSSSLELPLPLISIDYKNGTVYVQVQSGIAVINGTSNKMVGEIPINFYYTSMVFDSSTDTIYGSTGCCNTGSLIGVNSHTGKVTANVSIGYSATDVLVNPQLNLIYAVGCDQQGLACNSVVSVVNGTNDKVLKEVHLGSAYYATATIDEKTGFVYVSGENQFVALDSLGNVTYSSYPDTCGAFSSMADDPVLNQVIMAPQNYDYLLVYNAMFGNLLNMYSLPDAPQHVAFNPVTNETYVIVSDSLLTFKGMASTGHVNDTLIGAGQFCLPV